MLYPIFPVLPEHAAGMHVVPAGHLAPIPVSVPPGGHILLTLVHVAPVQDYSLRCYVAQEADGEVVGGLSPEGAYLPQVAWSLRRQPQTLLLHDRWNQPAADDRHVAIIPVDAGTCYLHILNLIGTENAFSLAVS